MRQNDYDPEISELVDGVPTAKNQDGETIEELLKDENIKSAFDGFPLD